MSLLHLILTQSGWVLHGTCGPARYLAPTDGCCLGQLFGAAIGAMDELVLDK